MFKPQIIAPSNKPLKVLCLGAHSDDIEIGCGATVLKLSEAMPVEFSWVVFSSGEVRGKEAKKSAELFLEKAISKEVIVKDFRNGFFPYIAVEIKEYFESLKSTIHPDLIFTHCNKDLHQDHRLISELTWNTFRNHWILEFEIPKYDGDFGTPNIFFEIDEQIARRKANYIIESFPSQKSKHWFTADTFLSLLRLRGVESASPFAEAFYCRKTIL